MEQLVGNLIDAYRVSISNSTWLGDETKAKALEKLSKFVPKIGYTNHWRDYSALDVREDAGFAQNMRAANLYETGYQLAKVGKAVDKDEWLMNPQTVNAYYEPSMNVIVFPAAILQPPFFNPDAEDAANYGGIGAVIGHEIGHGFDDQGSQYDGDGKLNDWWTEEDKANFKALTQKLIDQYNEFVPTQLAEKYSDDPSKAPHVNGALTIGENIGDLSGVNIALKAYAFALDEAAGRGKDGSTEAIEAALADAPEIDGFTGLQRFFLSYASIWRTKNRDELAEQYLQIDPHSPPNAVRTASPVMWTCSTRRLACSPATACGSHRSNACASGNRPCQRSHKRQAIVRSHRRRIPHVGVRRRCYPYRPASRLARQRRNSARPSH